MMIEYLLKNLTCVTSVDPNAIVSHRSSKKHYKSFSGCQLVMRGLIKAPVCEQHSGESAHRVKQDDV